MHKVTRVPTGIKNFDDLVGGGFPEGFTVLLSGTPGTGKSIFGLEYVYNGAEKYGENCIYISLEQNVESLKNQALMFGWDFEKSGSKALITFLKPEGTIEGIIDKIREYTISINAKRMVIDSFTTLFSVTSAYGEEIVGKQILKKGVLDFFNKIKELNCTILLISEIPTGTEKLSEDGMSEFAADGIVLLKKTSLGNEAVRILSVEKMRHTKITGASYNLEIDNDGITLKE